MIDQEYSFSDQNSSKSFNILFELCNRNDIILENEMLTEAKKNLKNEGAKGSNELAQLITELTDCRSARINLALNVALYAEQTPELVSVIQRILKSPAITEGIQGRFISEIFSSGKIGWTDSTYKLAHKNAKEFLSKVSNITSKLFMYQLLPLFTVDMEVPDIPSARFSEIDDAIYLNSGSMVFKAKINWGKKQLSGLFSFNKNGFKTIITEDGIINTPYSESLFKGLRIQFLSYNILGYESNYHFNGNDLLYLNVRIKAGIISGYTGVFCWDGEYLKKVLMKGDEIQDDEQSHIIHSARLLHISDDGIGLICYKSNAPENITGLATCIKYKIKPLYENQEAIIGVKNHIINLRSTLSGEFGLFNSYGAYSGTSSDFEVKSQNYIFDDRIVSLVGDSMYQHEGELSIFKWPEKKIEKIIGAKDDYPFPLKSYKIFEVYSIYALNKEKILISVMNMPKSAWQKEIQAMSHIILYDKGNYTQLNSIDFPYCFHITHAVVLPDEVSILYSCDIFNKSGGVSDAGLFLFRGNKIINLMYGFNVSSVNKIKLVSYPYKGAIIWGKKNTYSNAAGLMPETNFRCRFLNFDHLGKGLQPVPEIEISSDQSIPLNEILVWKNKKEAIVVKKEGVSLLIDNREEF